MVKNTANVELEFVFRGKTFLLETPTPFPMEPEELRSFTSGFKIGVLKTLEQIYDTNIKDILEEWTE